MTVSCDFELPAIYRKKNIRAAKDHICCECRGTIKRGETYSHAVGLWDGRWDRFRTCTDCAHLICEITDYFQGGCGWLHGGMGEQMAQLQDDVKYAEMSGAVPNQQVLRLMAQYKVIVEHRGARTT